MTEHRGAGGMLFGGWAGRGSGSGALPARVQLPTETVVGWMGEGALE
jgi:hypothetical protein